MTDKMISHAWLEAAADLGVRVAAPFSLSTGTEVFVFEAFIADFGNRRGTVVGKIDDMISGVREAQGYFASDLGPSYRSYTRQLFVDTLNDWGWYGESGQEPSWYTGAPWS